MGKGNGSFYIGLDYNPTFNGIKDLKIIGETDEDEMDVLTGARGLFPMNALASNVTDFNSYHFDWSTPLPGLEFGNSTLALGGSIGYRIGGARVEVGIGHERFVIKGGDDAAFLLGRELALDTARGQLLSSALGRMSMGDVHRLKKEVVDSIGRGTASPVRAMFSREISDGNTLLAGEMVGVDEGLVIQELSRPEELEKLQHELAKQVSKLAELGELKWLEELEKLETEELEQGLEGALKALGVEASVQELVQRFKKEIADGKTPEEIKLEWIKEIEAKKLEEVQEQAEKKLAELELADKGGALGTKGEIREVRQLKELADKGGALGIMAEKLKKQESLKGLGGTVEELAAIRELKELGLEEQLRMLAEIKEVKRLAEKQKSQGLEAHEGLQLTEKIRALGGQLDLLEERLSEKFKRLQQNEQGIRKDLNPQAITAVAGKLDEIWVLGTLGQLDELVPGKRAQTLGEMKATLKELEKIRKLVDLEKKLETMGELKKEIEKINEEGELLKLEAKIQEEAKAEITTLKSAERYGTLKENLKELEKKLGEVKSLGALKWQVAGIEPGTGSQGGKIQKLADKLKNKLGELVAIRELKELGFKDWLRLRTLEELTEIAEKRGVATVMKAALASAMEIAKNRGWTDYLTV
ncbi:P44/Msp2 family outer membrane protein [Anaplasma marginale]|uniref:P44/Msp2 family outer membrane protein n=1 Tax=Anaplasma marginale TaxID=770 RepID=UPI0002FCB3AD|nr:P44/Msp2 family outer membrane protein [Anaplasma marginale]